MRELEDQKRLIETVFSREPLPAEEKGLIIQRSLVRHRFHEVLSNAFPLWYARVDKEAFEASLYAFMQHGAQSLQIWKTPDEYRAFVQEKQLFAKMPYTDDLLWFEWIEVALIMRDYQLHDVSDFSYDKVYRLSQSCALRHLQYKVFAKDSIEIEGAYALLAYYDFGAEQVFFREISEVLMLFLEALQQSSMPEALHTVAKLAESREAEVMAFLEETLGELLHLRIIEENNIERA